MARLELDLSISFWENVDRLHARVKKLKEKIKRLREHIEKAKKEMEAEKKEKVAIIRRRERDWYEKFRWAFTSGRRLLLGGRDARTNEQLIRKYLEENDIVFHADIHGAPIVLLKDGKNASEKEITEAAIFAGAYSKAWKEGFSAIDVFYAPAQDVSLTPPSGEYRPRGGVMFHRKIRIDVPLYLYVGFDEEKGRFYVAPYKVMGGIKIVPGRREKSELAKEILRRFGKGKEYLDDLLSILPPGGEIES